MSVCMLEMTSVQMGDAHPEKDEGDEGTDDEAPIDHGVWGKGK